MDALPLLRSYRDDLPVPDAARLAAVRARLEPRWAPALPQPVQGGFPSRRVAVGAMAAVAASGLVAAVVTAGPAPQASAEVARVLGAAAATAAADGGAPAAARTVRVRLEGLSEQIDADGRVVAAYNTRLVRTTRVPAGDGVWTRSSYALPPDAFYGGAAARALAAEEAASGGPAPTADDPMIERSADGTFTNGELGGGTTFGSAPTALRALPTDPAALLDALRRADLGVGRRAQARHVLEAASVVLSSGVVDGRLQAAVFRALRLQTGLEVVDRGVVLDGRRGVAIGETTPSWRFDGHQLVIDPATGDYLGDRDVALLRQGVIPAGALLSATVVLPG